MSPLFKKNQDTDTDIELDALLKELQHARLDFDVRSSKMVADIDRKIHRDNHDLAVDEHDMNTAMADCIKDISDAADEILDEE